MYIKRVARPVSICLCVLVILGLLAGFVELPMETDAPLASTEMTFEESVEAESDEAAFALTPVTEAESIGSELDGAGFILVPVAVAEGYGSSTGTSTGTSYGTISFEQEELTLEAESRSLTGLSYQLFVNGELSSNHIEVVYGDSFQLVMSWSIQNTPALQNGVVFESDIASGLADLIDLESSGILWNGDQAVGEYTITSDGHLRVVYTNTSALGGLSNVTGQLSINGRFDVLHGVPNEEKRSEFLLGEVPYELHLTPAANVGTLGLQKTDAIRVNDTRCKWVVILHAEGTNNNVQLTDTLGSYFGLSDGSAVYVSYMDEALSFDNDVLVSSPETVWRDAIQCEDVTDSFVCNVQNNGFTLSAASLPAGTYFVRYESSYDYETAMSNLGTDDAAARTNTVRVHSAENANELVAQGMIASEKTWITKDHSRTELPGAIEWQLRLMNITHTLAQRTVTITDTLPANTEFEQGSVRIRNGEGYVYTDQAALNANIDQYVTVNVSGNVVVFTLSTELLEKIAGWEMEGGSNAILSYRTKIVSQTEETAGYTNGFSAIRVGWPAVTGSDYAEHTNQPFLKKSADYTSSTAPYVDYTLKINPENYHVSADSLIVRDRMGSALTYVMDSARVVDAATGSEITNFEEVFSDGVLLLRNLPADRAFTVTYRARLNTPFGEEIDENTASNSAEVLGVNINGSEDTVILRGRAITPNGRTSGESASIRLYKFAEGDSAHALSGAKFRLESLSVDRENGVITGTEGAVETTTAEDGELSFGELMFDVVYRVKEVSAPEGYVLDDTPCYVVFAGHDHVDWVSMDLVDEEGQSVDLSVFPAGTYAGALFFENAPIPVTPPTTTPTPDEPEPTTTPAPDEPQPTTTPEPEGKNPEQTPIPLSPEYPRSDNHPSEGTSTVQTSRQAPKTGDDTSVAPWLLLTLLPASVLAVGFCLRRGKHGWEL